MSPTGRQADVNSPIKCRPILVGIPCRTRASSQICAYEMRQLVVIEHLCIKDQIKTRSQGTYNAAATCCTSVNQQQS